MGTYKEYSPAIAGKALRFSVYWENVYHNTNDSSYMQQVPEWYDLNGTVRNHMLSYIVYWNTSNTGSVATDYAKKYISNIGGLCGFRGMQDSNNVIPYATADELSNFNIYDHEINGIGSTTFSYSNTRSQRASDFTYAVRVVNNTVDKYEQNTDVIWHDDIEYFIEDSENSGQYIDVTAALAADHSTFTEHYNEYYIFVPAGPITVKCIKFKKKMYYWGGDGNRNALETNVLHSAYFLNPDEWITIPLGESRVIIVDFSEGTA